MSFTTILEQLSTGMARTVEIFFLTLIFSLPLGLLIAFGRMSKNKILSGFIGFVISILRGTPLMLQLMVWYFFPYYLFGWPIGNWRFPAIILGFSINYAAYFAEIYRSGIEAIPKGQYEASNILGYSKVQTFFKNILPQVIKIILPSITNEIITLVKDTSLARIIAVEEIIMVAQRYISAKALIWPLFYTGVFYLLFCGILTLVFGYLEKKLDYYKA